MTTCTTTVDRRSFVNFSDGRGGVSYPDERSLTVWKFDDGVEIHAHFTPSYKTVYNNGAGRHSRPRFERKRHTHSRCYVSDLRPFNLAEDLDNRTRRPHTVWKPLVVEALGRIGVKPEAIHWNQRAGCSCGCSPAFILKGVTNAVDFTVVLSDVPSVDYTKPGRLSA